MRIGFLMERSFTDGRSVPDVIRLLRELGATAKPLHLGDDLIDIARVRLDYDLYVLNSRSDLAMSLAADLHAAGAALLNPYPVSALLRDRITTSRVLRGAGVTVPETFVASQVSQLLPALHRGPLIVKPYRRPGKRRAKVVSNEAELAALGPIEEPVFAQRYHPPDGGQPDRSIYSIGGDLFGVLRDGPARTYEEKKGAPFTLSPELVDIARRCGAAFGIDLFDVDVVVSGDRSYVVDMSSFPGFNGVPDAPVRLAKYIYAAAGRAARGEPIAAADSPSARPPAGHRPLEESIDVVLRALSTTLATLPELDQIESLITQIRTVRAEAPRRSPQLLSGQPQRRARTAASAHPRVAMYSQGMVGFGHIRRNASIAHALRRSTLEPVIVMIAEAWQAGALPLPAGVDCVTLPALRRDADGTYNPRFLFDVSDHDVMALRAEVIRSAMEVFEPDVLIVDHLPLGVANELTGTLERMRRRGTTRCVLGVREVIEDPETAKRTWSDSATMDGIRDYYDAVWIYGDPDVYDTVREYGVPAAVAAKARYTGYLDQRPRLELAATHAAPLLAKLPPGRLVVCVVGGGHDGGAIAEAFLQADLPPDTTGVLVTGPLMPWEARQRVHKNGHRPGFEVLEFVPDPTPLIARADRVIAMGGYNTVCEVLSFEKHALIVPRVRPEREQWIRAQRMRELGLVHVLHPDELSPRALTDWLARDLGPPPTTRSRIDLGGLTRIPGFLAELLDGTPGPVRSPEAVSTSQPG